MTIKQLTLLLPLLCAPIAMAQYQDYSQMGKTPAELRFIDDPLKIELKEPSWFWHNPKKDTAEEQLVYAMQLEQKGKWEKAVEAYDDLVHEWHASPEALTAQLSIARLNSIHNQTQAAYDADIYLLAHFAGRFELDPVLRDAVAQADLLVSRDMGRTFRHNSSAALRANYERIIHFAPRWPRVPELLLKIADIYMKNGEYDSAITVCDRIIIDWGSSIDIDEILTTYCTACRKQADVWQNDTGRLKFLEDLIGGVRTFAPSHAHVATFTEWQKEIYLMRQKRSYEKAVFYDNPQAYSIEAAINAYKAFLREFPEAPQKESVNARIAALSISHNAPQKDSTP